jgi:hypothetical protein
MKVSSLSLSLSLTVIIAVSAVGVGEAAAAPAPVASTPVAQPITQLVALTADRVALPADYLTLINRCNCFVSVTRFRVRPVAPAADVFRSDDVLFSVLDLDIQLPWVGVGEVGTQSLFDRIRRSSVEALNRTLILGNRSGGIRVGLYAWSHPTAPDFCSGEVLQMLYFPADGTLVAFRYDNSHEC